MSAPEVCPEIRWCGAKGRTDDLFQGQWPLLYRVDAQAGLVVNEKVTQGGPPDGLTSSVSTV